MYLSFLLLAAAAVAPVPADLHDDARCVVVIAQAARTDTALAVPGREYAAQTGAAIMDATGRTREQARDVLAQALGEGATKSGELALCKRRMSAALSTAPLPVPGT